MSALFAFAVVTAPATPMLESAVAEVPSSRGSPDEAKRLRTMLGASEGVKGFVQCAGRKWNAAEKKAWVRLGELIALEGTRPV